jgi:RNA polymerase sigma factor for flagellar operon FliA
LDRDGEQLFLAELPYIDSVICHACRKSRLSPEDADDFASEVKAKLIDRNYEVFRKFEERSSLRTYLLVVIRNALLDWLDKRLGKWRHSAAALRLGEVAKRIEELHRDGFTFDETCAILRSRYKVTLSEAELTEIRAQLPFRTRRRWTGEQDLENAEATEPRPDERLLRHEAIEARRRLIVAAETALRNLPAEDRILFWVTKVEGSLTVAQFARARGLDAKELYRRIEKVRATLRGLLENQGFRKEDLDDLFPA